jgi:histidine triad (HIT) family protein
VHKQLEKTMSDCIFCKIAAGEIPGDIVHQDEAVVAFNDINPAAPTHILIIPVKHIASMAEADQEDQAVLGGLLLRAKAIAHEKGLEEKGYRLVINTGREAGQAVFHIHLHLLAGRAMSWPPG